MSAIFMVVLIIINLALGHSREFITTILAGLLSLGILFGWLCIWLGSLWQSWKEDWPHARSRFAATMLSMPIGLILALILFGALGRLLSYFEAGRYESLIADDQFLAAVRVSSDTLQYDGKTVQIDRSDKALRLAFDQRGYVVRSSAYVYDPTGMVGELTGSKSERYFGSELSHCVEVRQDFYRCSFS